MLFKTNPQNLIQKKNEKIYKNFVITFVDSKNGSIFAAQSAERHSQEQNCGRIGSSAGRAFDF